MAAALDPGRDERPDPLPGTGGSPGAPADPDAAAAASPWADSASLELDPAFVRQVLDTDPNPIVVKDEDGRVRYANRATAELFSTTVEGIIGRRLREFHDDPDELALYDRVDAAVLRTRKPVTVHETVTRADGRVVWLEMTKVPLVLGGRMHVLGVARDITAKKAAEDALADQERWYRTLIARSSDLVTVGDGDGRFRYVSPAVEPATGIRPDELLGRPVDEMLHPDDRAGVLEALAAIRGTPLSQTTHTSRIRYADGSWHWVESVVVNLLDDPVVHGVLSHSRDVTDRVEAEASLRAAEARFRALVQHAADLVLLIDAEGAIQYASPASERLLGYDPEAYRGRSVLDLLHADDRASAVESLAGTAAVPGRAVPIEVRVRRADGRWRRFEVVATNLLDDPAVAGIVVNGRDVTDRTDAEESLRRAEARFRALVEHSEDMIVLVGPDGRVRYASPSLQLLTGRSLEDLTGADAFGLVHPDDAERVRDLLISGVARGLPAARAEYRVPRWDGTWAHVETLATNRLDDPDVQGVILNTRDITDRRRMEEAVVASEREFRLLAENATDLIVRYDAGGTRRYVSPSARRVLGYAPEQLVGRPAWDLLHPDDAAPFAEALDDPRAAAQTRPDVEVHLQRVRHADGHYLWLESTVRVLRDPVTGEVTEVQSSSRDVSARVAAEAALRDHLALQDLVTGASASVANLSADALPGALAHALGELARFLGADRGWAVRLPEAGGDPEPVAGWPEGSPVTELIGPALLARLWPRVRAGEPVLVPGDPPDAALAATLSDHDLQLLVALPLVVEGRAFGMIGLAGRGAAERVPAETVDLLHTFADVAGSALARAEAERELRAGEERYRALVAGVPDLLFRLSADGTFIDWAPSDSIPLVAAPEELLGRNVREVLPSVAGRLLDAAARARSNGQIQTFSYQLPEIGERGHFEARVGVLGEDELLVVVRDVSEEMTAKQALEFQALHDPLTGLANRSLFFDQLAQALARSERRRGQVALLFVDLDRFKVINDSLGHDAGDRLLIEVAGRVRSAVRPGDSVARFGGDEFAVVCEDLDGERQAVDVAERVAAAICQPIALAGMDVVVTASTGIVLGAGWGTAPAELLRDADAAMYRAKERGRARVEVFDQSMRALAVARLADENDLRRAVAEGRLLVHYQPQVDLATGRIVGVEGLLRWEHPERGTLAPASFLAVAEETGLIVPIGAQVLEQACRDALPWLETRPELVLWVNLSARQVADAEAAALLSATCRATGFPPERLGVEVTETALLTDLAAVQRNLEAMRATGTRVAVDDFGTGYSSLAHLRRLPLDVVKVDRAFVDGLGSEPDDTAIVAAVVGMGRALGLATVAEGVEQREQIEALRALGCDHAQGFYFGRPVPAVELAALLRAGPLGPS
ncbi:MAG: PAS domain S-box protein [Acidimicrobiales bacterium]|nr:PAS domain S-box protein [Acidimicrobiales bacterium]